MPEVSTSSHDSFRTDSQASFSTSGQHNGSTSPSRLSSDIQRPNDFDESMNTDSTSEKSDTDTQMADARSNFDESFDIDQDLDAQRVQNQDLGPDDLLKNIPNVFRLLDLVDEHGSGGIVEKVVIDQNSLHRVLNVVQPGSYDSVSKINFKALDDLSIKPTGIYGNRSEIITFLWKAQYLDETSVALLSRVNSPDDSTASLRSGLYLVLDPNHRFLGPSKNAYTVPLETSCVL
ncbi:hypothetical protein OPQ81_003408 [Rhizoctonia solani]|nr:hypothetical protein OPQ81_003408 [Rhizoctonia solani]